MTPSTSTTVRRQEKAERAKRPEHSSG